MARTVRDTNLDNTNGPAAPSNSKRTVLARAWSADFSRISAARQGRLVDRPAAQRDGGAYTEHRIGTTDDLQDADGVAMLDYGHAQRAAGDWWRAERRREEGHDSREGPLTVADAFADYLKAYEERGGKAVYDTRRSARHISCRNWGRQPSPSLRPVRSPTGITRLAEKRASTRTRPGRKQNFRKAETGPDALRKAPRHRKPNPDRPESRSKSRLEGRPRHER